MHSHLVSQLINYKWAQGKIYNHPAYHRVWYNQKKTISDTCMHISTSPASKTTHQGNRTHVIFMS